MVLQTVMPALLVGSMESRIALEGGVHNPAAPPFDFLEKSFLPFINRMGPAVEVRPPRLLSSRRRTYRGENHTG